MYASDEQRSPAGCIGGQSVHLISRQALGARLRALTVLLTRSARQSDGAHDLTVHDQRNAAFFPDGRCKSNFLVNLGYGDPAMLRPRAPRLDFDEACRIE